MRLPNKTFYLLLLVLSLALRSHARTCGGCKLIDSIPGYINALKAYHAYMNPEQALYRGGQYVQYTFLLSGGHPYFIDDRMQKGTVVYDSILYGDVLLQYDLVKDVVVVNEPFNFYKVILFPQLVDRFTVGSHVFFKMKDTLGPGSLRPGFYERLYSGSRIGLIKKQTKNIEDDVSGQLVRYFIVHDSSFYLQKGKNYYSVNNKKALLAAMKDRSREARAFMRSNHLSMKTDKEGTLMKMIVWYDGSAGSNPTHN